MNYYRRYVGDYLRDTSRLSMMEHGAYNLLLDYYYAEERPISADLEEVYRVVRAILPEERRAISKVLSTFFQKRDDGYHHKRVDNELAIAKAVIEKQRQSGVESAAKRWSTDGSTHESTHKLTDGSTQAVTHAPSIQPPTTNHQPPAFNPPTATSNASGSRKNGARLAPLDASPVVEVLPLRDGSEFAVRQSLVSELEPIYQAVDIPATLKEMKGWLLLNPDRRKTKAGVRRFIGKWLQSEQEKHGR